MKRAAMCIVSDVPRADAIVVQLKAAGFQPDDISALFPSQSGTRDFAHVHNTKAPEGAVAGASIGGLVGGALGVLAGIGVLAVPGIGPFIAAGPIMAGLSGVATGGAFGGLAGALVGMGMPEMEAKRYEDQLQDGNILLSVHTEDSASAKIAAAIFREMGGTDICSATESKAPKSSFPLS